MMPDDDEDLAADFLSADMDDDKPEPEESKSGSDPAADSEPGPDDSDVFRQKLKKPEVDPEKVSPKKKKIARELWERLARSRPGPDHKDLMFLARFVPLLSSSAAKTLLGKTLTLEELKELIQYVPKAKDAAIKQALKMGSDLSEDDVRFIYTHSKSEEVGKYLLKKYPNDANLSLVERTTEGLKDLVAEIREREPTGTVLREIDRKL